MDKVTGAEAERRVLAVLEGAERPITLLEIAHLTGLPSDGLETVLAHMLRKGKARRQTLAGRTTYARKGKSVPCQILDILATSGEPLSAKAIATRLEGRYTASAVSARIRPLIDQGHIRAVVMEWGQRGRVGYELTSSEPVVWGDKTVPLTPEQMAKARYLIDRNPDISQRELCAFFPREERTPFINKLRKAGIWKK